jgi:hypothetical protein
MSASATTANTMRVPAASKNGTIPLVMRLRCHSLRLNLLNRSHSIAAQTNSTNNTCKLPWPALALAGSSPPTDLR